MAQIKVLKFIGGIPREINSALDDIVAKSFVVGGPSGTTLTKAILDTLSSGSSDASSLHNHDTQYWRKTQHIASSSGAASAALPIETDSRGKLDPSFYQQSDITHGNLSGLSSDDHPQYYNQTRGDARYYQKTEFINSSAGAADAGKPVKTNAAGQIDGTMLAASAGSINHENLAGLQGGAANDHLHLTTTQHDTLTNGSDATALHNHDSRYYTKTQSDASLALKANDNIVIKKDGSVSFTADQSLGGHKITNLADGLAATDAATKGQMDTADALALPKAGGTMSGNIDMGGNKVTNLGVAVVGTDAVNKNYVDNKISGISWRPSAQLYSTAATKPATTATLIDGVTVTTGIRVLFVNASPANQVFTAAVSGGNITWTVATDGQAGTGSPTEGDAILITEGTNYLDTAWVYSGSAFIQFNGAGSIQAGVGLFKTGNTLSVQLGAGIAEAPTSEVGLDLYINGGLALVDPSTGLPSTADTAQLSAKVDDTTIQTGASGLAVKDAGITASKLATDSVTTIKIASKAVTTAKIADLAVDTLQLAASSVTTAKLAAASVTAAKLAADTAGAGLVQNVSGALDVNPDNSTVEVVSDTIRVKDAGITTAKIAPLAVDATKIDFGTGTNQVKGANIPLIDAANQFATKNVAAALAELATAGYIESFTAGETIGQGDVITLRRDASNVLKAFKASAAGSDNYISGTLVVADLTFTAVTPSGNNISVVYINPQVINAALSVSATGNAISISLATDGSGAITSTASQINTAVNSSPSASALVSSAVTGTGSTIQTAHTAAFLSGGMDFNDNGRWSVEGMALDAATSGASFRVQKFGALAANFVSAPTASQIGQDVYLSINQGKLAVATAPTNTNDAIVYVGRLRSLTQVEFKASILRGVNG
jgi:hypothetical protein